MNKIEQMIKDLCPDGVKWVKLGEVCEILTGYPFDSAKFANSGIKLMRGINVKRGYFDFNEDDDRYWSDISGLEKYLLQNQDIIVSMDGSLVGKSFAIIEEKHLPLILVQRVARIRAINANIRYVYYNICHSFTEYVDNKKTAGAIPHISLKDISNFSIPLPPLPIQEQIVTILDKFESMRNNLEKELSLRRKQYEHYREKLLTFGEDVERKKLGEVCDVITGGEAPDDIEFIGNEKYKYPIWGNGKEVYGFSSNYKIGVDAVCISSIGANTGALFFHKAFFTPIVRLKVIIPVDVTTLLPKYLFYSLSIQKIKSKSSSVPNMNASDVKKVSFPLPPLSTQEAIVSKLDKFEALISNIERELELRTKQYEYYRERLLTFPPA